MEDLRILFFFYLVQSFLMTIVGCKFFNVETSTSKLAQVSIMYGLGIWMVRSLYAIFRIPYGTHTLVLAIIYCLLLLFIMKLDLTYCLGIVGFTFSLAMLGGGLVGLGVTWYGKSVEYVFSNVWLHIAFGHIENLLLFLYLIVDKTVGLSLNKMERKVNE